MDDDFDGRSDRPDGDPDEDRSAQVRGALLKALAVVVVIGVVIALGTTVMVRALGLNENESPGPVGAAPSTRSEPLPTTALPVPGDEEPSQEPSQSPSASPSPPEGSGDIELGASPVRASPMQRINLTGNYKGADNLSLEVQRLEGGRWSNFGVDATVRAGSYATYVQTGRAGAQRFRMYDPETKEGSNVVLVTIG